MKFILLSFAFLCTFSLSAQQVIGFEDRVPEEFTSPDKKSLSLSNRYYKEGKKVWNGILFPVRQCTLRWTLRWF